MLQLKNHRKHNIEAIKVLLGGIIGGIHNTVQKK